MKKELKELIGKEDNLCDLSNEFISLGYSDMFDIGNFDECVEEFNSIALQGEYEEINICFEIVRMCNKEEYETHTKTIVRIIDIEYL